jgi:2-aminoadipate transaminase
MAGSFIKMDQAMLRNGWSDLAVEIDRESVVPIYRQIVERVREQILTGALPAGTRLPPERSLAAALTVNRSTIVHAYRDLAVAGLIDQRVGSGSRVAERTPGQAELGASVPWWVSLPFAPAGRSDRIAFGQGVPPAEPSPLADLARSFERAGGDPNAVLRYGDSEGFRPLRETIAARMRLRGARIDPRDVLMLTGATQGLALAAQSLAEPGDEIIVEAPTYPGALQVFSIHGLRPIPVPVDADGMRVDHVEAVLRTRRPRFIYTQPSLHNPTGVTLTEERRERLVALAVRAGVPIVEDDPYGELAPARSLPLVARNADHVIYLSSFSKTIAPSLRLGWLCAPRTIFERLLLRKQSCDAATSLYVQTAVWDYVRTAYDVHLPLLRAELQARRSIAFAAIDEFWPATIGVERGGGGFYLWATAPREARTRVLLEAAERRGGASFRLGDAFFAQSGGDGNFRLALTPVPRDAIAEGIRSIGAAIAQ